MGLWCPDIQYVKIVVPVSLCQILLCLSRVTTQVISISLCIQLSIYLPNGLLSIYLFTHPSLHHPSIHPSHLNVFYMHYVINHLNSTHPVCNSIYNRIDVIIRGNISPNFLPFTELPCLCYLCSTLE